MSPRPLRVLVVDDHPGFRRAARALLGACGFLVVGEADCGAGAQHLVDALRPAITRSG